MKEQPRWRRYAQLFGANPRSDTEDELSFHLEMRTEDYMRRGMTEAAARAAAAERVGDLDGVRRECARVDDTALRVQRRVEWFGELQQDVRYGVRTLVRAPAFTLMAVITLSIGIGATTAVFSLFDAVLLSPLPYDDPERLVQIWETSPQGFERNVVSAGNVIDWPARARSFETMGAYRGGYGVSLTGGSAARHVQVLDMQPSLARVLGVDAALGRTLEPEDERGTGDVVVLNHRFWEGHFGADSTIIGRRIVVDGVATTVVGVMPRDFQFPAAGIDLWRPVVTAGIDPLERRSHNYIVIGRLAPDVDITAAQAEMTRISDGLGNEHPEFMKGWGVNVVSLQGDMTAHVRPLFTMLLAGVVLVLLIACGNIASLLLARAIAREREMAVRGALGAGRGRVARQLITESALLAGLGGMGALLIAPLLLHVLVNAAPADIPLLDRAGINGRMLLFASSATMGCAFLFGLAPSVRLLRLDLQSVLRGGRSAVPAGAARMRATLLVGQVAMAVVLLVGAGLFVRSFAALQVMDPGFDRTNLVAMSVDLPRAKYENSPQHVLFYNTLLERVRAIPGVAGVAGTNAAPGAGNGMSFSYTIEGRVSRNDSGREDPEDLRAITPDYFAVLDQPLIEGRAFTPADRPESMPVVIVNESLARKHWPSESPIGKRIAFRVGESPWLEIVGVVGDVRLTSLDEEPIPALYIPHAQKTWQWMSWLSIIARVQPGADEQAMQEALRTALIETDRDVPAQSLDMVDDRYRENIARRSFAMTLVAGFGAIAMLLSIVGLYGLLAYTVAQQRREIGVRLALGADASRVVRDVLRVSLMLALPGAAVGAIAAAAGSQVIDTMLYGVSPLDAATYIGTIVFVVVTALVTAFLPAARAARTSPLEALRYD